MNSKASTPADVICPITLGWNHALQSVLLLSDVWEDLSQMYILYTVLKKK